MSKASKLRDRAQPLLGVVLIEPILPAPLLAVTTRMGGLHRGAQRSFSDHGQARAYAVEIAERRGLLLVDLSFADGG